MKFQKNYRSIALCLLVAFVLLSGCVASMPQPSQVRVPTPILDNSGEFMSPYTQDDVVALWCDKGINASMGAAVGGVVGAYAGSKALEQIPFVGGFLGQKLGDAVGRKIAIEASGGMEYIKETSDISFNSIDDMIVWLYATKSNDEHYNEVVKSVSNIYPEYNKRLSVALRNASI